MNMFENLKLVLLILLVIVAIVFTTSIVYTFISQMVMNHRINKLKYKCIKDITRNKNNLERDLKEVDDFLNTHTDEDMENAWNSFFNDKPPFKLDAKLLRNEFKKEKDKTEK